MQLSTTAAPQTRQLYFSFTAMAHAAFVPTGMITVMLGPMLPLLAAKWSLNDSQSGYLISAQFLGALLGTISSSLLFPRWGFRRSMAAGQLLMAGGTGTLLLGSLALAVAAVFCYGIGIGLTIPAGNLAIAELHSQQRSSSLNLLNFSWSAGAVSCPFLLASLQRIQGTNLFLRGIAALLLALTAVLLLSLDDTPSPASRASKAAAPRLLKFAKPEAIMLGMLFFVYVGTENSLGVWLASYAKRANDSPASLWMLVSSYFYGALLLGRALSPLAARRLSDSTQACSGVLLAAVSSAGLLFSRSTAGISVCAILAGLGLSTLYPIAITLLSSVFGKESRSVGGAMFALSTLGGASLPWLVGFVSTTVRSLRTGLLIPFAGCLLMLVVFSRRRWRVAN